MSIISLNIKSSKFHLFKASLEQLKGLKAT